MKREQKVNEIEGAAAEKTNELVNLNFLSDSFTAVVF